MKKANPTFQLGVCSFCAVEKVQPVIQSIKGDVSICLPCTHDSSVAIGLRPIDSVCCYKCKSYGGFIAKYTNPTCSATFQYSGNDAEGIAMYVVTNVQGNWRSELRPTSFVCSSCSFAVSPAMVSSNPYLTPFFKKHLPVKPKRRKI